MWRLLEWFPTLFFISHCYFFVCFWELCLPNKGSLFHRPSLLFLWNYWKLFFFNSTKSRQPTFLLLNVNSLTIFSPTASQLFRSRGTETKEGRARNNCCTCQTGAGGGWGGWFTGITWKPFLAVHSRGKQKAHPTSCRCRSLICERQSIWVRYQIFPSGIPSSTICGSFNATNIDTLSSPLNVLDNLKF